MIDERAAAELLHRAGHALPVGPAPTALLRDRGRRRQARVRAVRVAAAAVAVAAVAAVPVVGGFGREGAAPPAASRRVPPPPADAAPGEVVRAYLAALDAHDIETARSLTTAAHAAKVDRAEDSWYRNVESIRDVRIDEPVRESGAGTHGAGYAEVVFVPVRFVLDVRDEASMPDGETVWGYRLGRQGAGSRWVIVDEGPI